MGTYLIPRDLKGEGRILFFSYKALGYTLVGLIPGYLMFLLIKPIHLVTAWIVMGIFAFIGFAIGTFPMPNSKGMEITKKTGGEKIDEISKIKTACQGKVLKVILETDLLTTEEIIKALPVLYFAFLFSNTFRTAMLSAWVGQ